MLECRVPAKLRPLIYRFRIYIRHRESGWRAITDREIQECLKHGDKETQAKGRIKHRHPLYNHGSRIVVITEANGTTVVTEFDRDNDL